jgi:hypothetical protein
MIPGGEHLALNFKCQSLPARLMAREPAFGGARGDQGSNVK